MMDGMHHATPRVADPNTTNLFGILYAEDFDNPSEADSHSPDEGAPAPAPPALTQADIDAACAAAVSAARAEWQLEDEQMRLNAITSLGPVLAGIRDTTEQAAFTAAEGTIVTVLSIVTGLLPHFSREHGPAEVRALLSRLLPTIRSQTRINVRVHSDLIDGVQRDIAALEPDLAAMIDVTAAPLERGDVKVSWENGSIERDSRKLVQAIQDALGQLGLHTPVEAPTKKRMAYAD